MTNKSKYNGTAITTLLAITLGVVVTNYFVGRGTGEVVRTIIDQTFALGIMWWSGRKYVQ